jgi:hypothetical protein
MQPMYVPENAVPPEKVRFEDLKIEPLPDMRRVRVRIGITPFTVPPNLRVTITTPDQKTAASAAMIETINHRMQFTLHLKSTAVSGNYTLAAEIYYADIDPVDQRSEQFQFPIDDQTHGE